jgi:hypothetical protein
MAARIATISGKAEPTLYGNQSSELDAFSRDVLEIEITAARAVRVALKARRHPPGVKPAIAGMTAPRPQTAHAIQEV